MNKLSTFLFSASDRLRFWLFVILYLFPGFLFGMHGKGPIFLMQVMTAAIFFLFLSSPTFFKFRPSILDYSHFWKPFLIFSLFFVYVYIQWLGHHAVFTGFIPGSIARYRTMDYLTQLVTYMLLFFVCYDVFATRKRIRIFTFFMALSAVFMIVLGYYQELSHAERFYDIYGIFPVPQELWIFYSTVLNPNHYGGLLLMISLFFIGSVLYYLETIEEKVELDFNLVSNILYLCLLPIMMASMMHAMARAALIMEFIILIAVVMKGVAPGYRPKALLAVAVIIGGFFVFILITKTNNLFTFYKTLWDVIVYRFTASTEFSRIFLDFPLFGTGFGTFMYISGVYQKLDAGVGMFLHGINYNLELLNDTGLVGYSLFVPPIVYIVIKAWKKCKKSSSRYFRIYGLTSFMAMVAIAVFCTGDDYLRTPAIAMMFIAHLAVFVRCANMDIENDEKKTEKEEEEEEALAAAGAVRASYAEEEMMPFSFGPKRFALWIVAGAFLSALLFYGAKSYVAFDRSMAGYNSYYEYRSYWPSPGLATRYESLYAWQPSEPGKPKPEKPRHNIGVLKEALALRPEDAEAWTRLGEAYYDEAEVISSRRFSETIERSISYYQTAVRICPTWGPGWKLLGRARLLYGDTDGGFDDIIHGIELSRYDRNGYLYIILCYIREAEKAHDLKDFDTEKEYREAARDWFLRANQTLDRPFTEKDRGYLCRETINVTNDRCPDIQERDRQRLQNLIEKFGPSKPSAKS